MRLRPFAIITLLPIVLLTLLLLAACAQVPLVTLDSGTAIVTTSSGVVVVGSDSLLSNYQFKPPTVETRLFFTPSIVLSPQITLPFPRIVLREPEPDWEELRNQACKTYMDVDLKRAYERFQTPVFWTFHTNFLDPNPTDNPDVRFGCLHYYWRDNSGPITTTSSTTSTTVIYSGHTFTATVKSAVLVGCQKNNTGVMTTQNLSPSIPSSAGLRQATDPSLPQRVTQISERAYLECPLDIGATLAQFAHTQNFIDEMTLLTKTSDVTEVLVAISNMQTQPLQVYPEFMTAAAVSRTNSSQLQTNSILFYEPQVGGAMTESLQLSYEVELSFYLTPTISITTLAASQLGGHRFDSSMVGGAPQCFAPSDAFYLWNSYGYCDNSLPEDCPQFTSSTPVTMTHVPYLEFLSSSTSNIRKVDICHVEPALVQNLLPYVPFYTGPAHFFVGYNPRTGESIGDELTIYEAWIDPDSAVKRSPDG